MRIQRYNAVFRIEEVDIYRIVNFAVFCNKRRARVNAPRNMSKIK